MIDMGPSSPRHGCAGALALLTTLTLLAAGCADDGPASQGPASESDATSDGSSTADEGSTADTDTDTDTDTGTDTDSFPVLPARCEAPAGLGSPQTIAEALALLNALPPPITVPCVVESLDRPLAIAATTSTISAQPAVDAGSPRIFIFSGPLILSIVPGGTGRDLLEFGEPRGELDSLKGELEMPALQPIPPGKPFDHLRYNEQLTVCGFCHRDERLAVDQDHPNAFISRALRPVDDRLVPLDDLRAEHAACAPDLEPERCAILSAVFDHGPVFEEGFAEELGTIFDP